MTNTKSPKRPSPKKPRNNARTGSAASKPSSTSGAKPPAKGSSRISAPRSEQVMRLQKFIAQSGICARRKAEELIQKGAVKVNGVTVTEQGTKIDSARDKVTVSGKELSSQAHALYLFYKPPRVVTTLSDPQERRCITDFTKRLPVRVYPVGRLDYNVTGLLLLTNWGEYSEQLQHPRNQVPRTYWAVVRGVVEPAALRQLLSGVDLEDGRARAKSAAVLSGKAADFLGPLPQDCTYLEVAVSEGRNHLVKRLCSAVGHPVLRLCRVQYGPYRLEGLKLGQLKQTTFIPLSKHRARRP